MQEQCLDQPTLWVVMECPYCPESKILAQAPAGSWVLIDEDVGGICCQCAAPLVVVNPPRPSDLQYVDIAIRCTTWGADAISGPCKPS